MQQDRHAARTVPRRDRGRPPGRSFFSQFTRFLAHVRDRLDAAGIRYRYLDGKSQDRAGEMRRFKDGTDPVFLISLKAGGFGLNLAEADYCFLLDP